MGLAPFCISSYASRRNRSLHRRAKIARSTLPTDPEQFTLHKAESNRAGKILAARFLPDSCFLRTDFALV